MTTLDVKEKLKSTPIVFTSKLTLDVKSFAPLMEITFAIPLEAQCDAAASISKDEAAELFAENVKQQFIAFMKNHGETSGVDVTVMNHSNFNEYVFPAIGRIESGRQYWSLVSS